MDTFGYIFGGIAIVCALYVVYTQTRSAPEQDHSIPRGSRGKDPRPDPDRETF
jgi:hypothetical protein